jgi:type VI secretion system secreted protein Hcp
MVLSRSRLLALAVAAVLLALVAWQLMGLRPATTNASAAVGGVHITMKVTGAKTGVFKGDETGKDAAGLITVLNYNYQVNIPIDASTGGASGKRQHSPVKITHEMGPSSPQFLNSLDTNEILNTVVINFYRAEGSGKNDNYYRVTLTNATVTEVTQYSSGDDVLENVSFTFQKIVQTDIPANTTSADDWESVS